MTTPETRRPIAAVAGAARNGDPGETIAEELGHALIDAGFRLITGGLGGVMHAVSRGARTSARYRPGDIIGVLPGYSAESASEYVDVPICTGLGHARNVVVVASGDVVFAVGGRAGTLSEMALAWTLGKPLIAVGEHGWAHELGGRPMDDRREDKVHGPFDDARAAVQLAVALIATCQAATREF